MLIAAVCLGIITCPSYCQVPSTSETISELPWIKGSTTLAVMPDTQYYAEKYPHHFQAQTRWIAENYEKRNIAYTLHLGDITQHDNQKEWEVAVRCFAVFDGKVPYQLIPGNHDYSGAPRKTQLSKFFPVSKIGKWPTFGGVYEKDKLDNNYHLFRIGKRDWITLGLECGPRKAVIAWANKVLEKYRDHSAIIVTHAYLFRNNRRYDYRHGSQRASPHNFHGDGADGEELWQQLIRKHPNVMIVISGHVATGGLGYLASEGDYGNTVHQMMACYQKMRQGGQGYMRLLEFLPDGKRVQVRTYSPSLKKTRTSKLEDFTFKLQGPTRETPKSVSDIPSTKLLKAPIHRYSFDGKGTNIVDTIRSAHGRLNIAGSKSALDGNGQLVLAGEGHVNLPPGLLPNEDVTFEVWFTPTADSYNWNSPVRFGSRGDWLVYTFRTRTTHRAEIAVNRNNQDIQRNVHVETGTAMHIVVTYDHDGANGSPLLAYYRDGESYGKIRTDLHLKDVEDTNNTLGPFIGKFDELRIYDYPLTLAEVQGNYQAGPNQLGLSK